MSGAFPSQRIESRISLEILVELYSLDNTTFEFANTIDISKHGARVFSKTPWAPQQRLSIRSVNGNLNARAHVVYCQRLGEQGYAIGLELHQPTDGWPGFPKTFSAKAGA